MKSHIIYPAKLRISGKDRTVANEDACEAAKTLEIKSPRTYLMDSEERLGDGEMWKRQTSKGEQQRWGGKIHIHGVYENIQK